MGVSRLRKILRGPHRRPIHPPSAVSAHRPPPCPRRAPGRSSSPTLTRNPPDQPPPPQPCTHLWVLRPPRCRPCGRRRPRACRPLRARGSLPRPASAPRGCRWPWVKMASPRTSLRPRAALRRVARSTLCRYDAAWGRGGGSRRGGGGQRWPEPRLCMRSRWNGGYLFELSSCECVDKAGQAYLSLAVHALRLGGCALSSCCRCSPDVPSLGQTTDRCGVYHCCGDCRAVSIFFCSFFVSQRRYHYRTSSPGWTSARRP